MFNTNMICTRLIGGLGNQLFQYAIGRKLSLYYNTELYLDIEPFNTYKLHAYSLQHFNIDQKFKTGTGLRRISERYFYFHSDFLEFGDNCYLDGYWQTEKYFSDIREVILRDLTLKEIPAHSNLVSIQKENSVSVHIRRADYVSNPSANNVHGTCSIEYYKNCINHLQTSETDLTFYIFSDDLEWCKNNLHISNAVYVNGTPEKNYVDLFLMSQCKHNICANSSYSWWGAWLNTNPDKKVYMPSKWFNNAPHDTRDIYPLNVIKMS